MSLDKSATPETLRARLHKQRSVPDWLLSSLLIVLSPFGGCFGMTFARQAWDEAFFPNAVRDGQYGMAVMFGLAPWAMFLGIVTTLTVLRQRESPGEIAWLGMAAGALVLVVRLLELAWARSALDRSFALFPVPWALALLFWSARLRSRAGRSRSA